MNTVAGSRIELAPLSVGAGVARATRWLLLLPRVWYRGWLAHGRAVGVEPERRP